MKILARLQYRHKIAAAILVFTLIPLLISGGVLFKRIWNERVQSVLSDFSTNISTYAAVTDRLMSSCIQKAMYLNVNPQIISFLSMEQSRSLVSTLTFIDYLQEMVGAINTDNSKAVVRLFALKNSYDLGDYYRSDSAFQNEFSDKESQLKERILALNYDEIIWKSRILNRDRYSKGIKEEYLCLYRKVDAFNYTVGIIEVGIPVRYLQELYSQEMPDGSFIALVVPGDEGADLVVSKGDIREPIRESVENYEKSGISGKYHVITSEITSVKGKVHLFVPKNYIMDQLKGDILIAGVTLLLFLAALITVIEVVSYYLTRKLSGLIGKMSKDLDDLINSEELEIYNSDDEIGRIGNKVFRLIKRVKEYYVKASEYEAQKRLLELELLQARFNPHFLYNTLGTMKSIIKDRRVQGTIDSMVKYYRIALNKGSSIIRISQELELIREYLKLQKFSYGNDFEVIMDIEPEVGKYSIIKHLLQPIVENALLHGVYGRGSGGVIKIKTVIQDGNILFEISDNGVGMDQEKLQKLIGNGTEDFTGGYGIRNVQKRIGVYYGPEYGLSIVSEIHSGTCVTMRIPAISCEDALNSLSMDYIGKL